MKIIKNSLWIIVGAAFFAGAACGYAYPPDNAAVLYYKAMVLYEADDAMAKMLTDFAKGDIGPDDKIREFVKKTRSIKSTLDASEIKNCDWGQDYSEGADMVLPHLGRLKKLAYLIATDARLQAADGHYEEALNRCMSLYKMARHANDKIIISYLVGNAIQKLSNDCVVWILGQMPQDVEILTRLKGQLAAIDSVPFSIKPSLEYEHEAIESYKITGTTDDVLHLLEQCGLKEESFNKKIRSFDQAMLDRNRQYFKDYGIGVRAAFDMPYMEGYAALGSLIQKVKDDAKSKPEAIFTAALIASFDSPDAVVSQYNKMLSIIIQSQTQDNAIRTATEIYLIKARTGKLPEALPAGLAGDLFSGKPFVYEKTKGGFVLRCQGKDLSKDEIYSYEFKVK
jgi:hypothetical protein